jgi:hypothetical protein
VSWKRDNSASKLQRLVGNAAYLVRVGTNVTSYTWQIKGKPVPPAYQWTTTGLNLFGFPAVTANAPMFDAFLAKAPELQNAEIYRYVGGDFGANNPIRVMAFRTTPVARGEAYWVRSGDSYNHYYGPFAVTLSGSQGGIGFSDSLATRSFRLRNVTAASLSVTLSLVASETPPTGQSNIAGIPPLLLRGSMNMSNLTYDCTSLPVGGSYAWTLAGQGLPGSEVEVVLGLSRSTMTNYQPGAFLAGVLRLKDSLGHAQVDMPVSATASSSAGLWVGAVAVTQVGQYLKSYQRTADGNLVVGTNGQYGAETVNTNLGSVPRPYPLRLIVHNPTSGSATLLQRVFYGPDAQTNMVVATQESALSPRMLSQARRISAAHLPWSSANAGWSLNGNLAQGAILTATVPLDYDDQASNPFVHAYHPDHDNLDATFKNPLPQGAESYAIHREITLKVTPPGTDFASLTTGSQTLSGDYLESITLLGLARAGGTNDTRQFQVRGSFSLNRISDIPTLTTR